MIHKKVLTLLAVSLIAVMVCGQTLRVNALPSYLTAINATATRLDALQSSTDFGWDWIVTGLTAHTGTASANNLYGVTALDLIHAYQTTGNSVYLATAKSVANYIAQGNPSTGAFLTNYGYSFDYEFLMEFAAASGISSYSTYAEASWTWQKANYPLGGPYRYMDGNQNLLWAHYFAVESEPGYAAWETADWGLAALQMGDTSWANNMASVIHSNIGALTTETITGNSGNNYPVIGMGEVLKFFEASPTLSATYASDITTLKARLIALQNPDGSWNQGDPAAEDAQSTAYAVMGLVAAHVSTSALNGANWLLSHQLSNGGWLETDSNEYSEVDSEAMSALIADSSVSVGGVWAPITMQAIAPVNGFEMLAPWIALAFLAVASVFAASRRLLRKHW